MRSKVLYVNHKAQKCGVYEFGRMIGETLPASERFDFVYCEADSWFEFKEIYDRLRPDAVIYNYHPCTMPWISQCGEGKDGVLQPQSAAIDVVQIGTIHEVYQESADSADTCIFDYHIAPDPTLLLRNPIVYKTGRLVPRYDCVLPKNSVVTVGSFGFATSGKCFERIVKQVQSEFDEAVINLNISFSRYMDETGKQARRVADSALRAVTKPGIQLNITHDHFNGEELLSFLAKNDINVFLYSYQKKRGVSSVVDWALAVHRPIAISKSSLFRHLFDCFPSICIEDHSIREILKNGVSPIDSRYEEWSPDCLIWDYERIMASVFSKESDRKKRITFKQSDRHLVGLAESCRIANLMRRLKDKLFPAISQSSSPWINRKSTLCFNGFTRDVYHSVVDDTACFNRILNDQARREYSRAVEFMWKQVPEIMKKKIPEANVQQGFVFDTAVHFAEQIGGACRLLSVGAFEDTAFLTMQKMGYRIDAVDPNINYDLATFKTRPCIRPASYDVIISTSVIEHVEDDESFVRDIGELLKPGGIAILTCDFHNDYVQGFPIPDVDCRFYTKKDIGNRLLRVIPECALYGAPHEWECSEYDFCFMNKYRYTFATFVFQKKG